MPDFTFEESDNYMYACRLEGMLKENLIPEYRMLNKLRRNGGDRDYALQMQFDILSAVAGRKGVDLSKGDYTREEALQKPHPDVEKIYTPESKSVDWFAYDFNLDTLYLKYKSGETVYEFAISYKVYDEMLDIIKRDESLGSFVGKKLKGGKTSGKSR